MREERLGGTGIPTRVYRPDGARGVLLLGHGGAHGKDSERFVRLCRTYAGRTGLAVACIDAVDHGERRPAGATPGIPPRWHSEAIDRMVADWQATATALSSVGPAVAYVGFSMGSIFGVATVAAMPTIRAAVLWVGGVPTWPGIDDPPLRDRVRSAAARLEHPEVLMLNTTRDALIRTEDAHALFDAIPGRRKRLVFRPGDHDDWSEEAIDHSVAFIGEHTG